MNTDPLRRNAPALTRPAIQAAGGTIGSDVLKESKL